MGSETNTKPKTTKKAKLERPKLYKVILVNDDYTPREFVIGVLMAVFRMSEEAGYRVMMTAHKLGTCVVVVCARDIAETKAKEATDLAKEAVARVVAVANEEIHHRLVGQPVGIDVENGARDMAPSTRNRIKATK